MQNGDFFSFRWRAFVFEDTTVKNKTKRNERKNNARQMNPFTRSIHPVHVTARAIEGKCIVSHAACKDEFRRNFHPWNRGDGKTPPAKKTKCSKTYTYCCWCCICCCHCCGCCCCCFHINPSPKIQPAVTTRAVRHLRKTLKKVIIKRTHAHREKKWRQSHQGTPQDKKKKKKGDQRTRYVSTYTPLYLALAPGQQAI